MNARKITRKSWFATWFAATRKPSLPEMVGHNRAVHKMAGSFIFSGYTVDGKKKTWSAPQAGPNSPCSRTFKVQEKGPSMSQPREAFGAAGCGHPSPKA